jgi:hypothetical protein
MPKKAQAQLMIPIPKRSLGGALGRLAGGLGSMLFPIKGVDGAQVGETIGSLLPFKRGGKAPARKRGGAVKARKRGGM